jgi:hypothetical protein
MPISANKIVRPRKHILKFSNTWIENQELVIKDLGYRAACESRGIQVVKAEDCIRSYLPKDETFSEEEKEACLQDPAELSAISDKTLHPFYHERPVRTFYVNSRLIMGAGLEQAKVLTNSVQIEEGLPKSLVNKIASIDGILPQGEDIMRQVLQDARIFDATQKILPRNKAVPNINWNPVIDRMHRLLPYPDGSFSWGRNPRREYGIPITRKKYVFENNKERRTRTS